MRLTERLAEFWESLTLAKAAIGVGLFLLSLAFSFASIAVVMVKIPADYFSSGYVHNFLPNSSRHVRWGAIVAKNIFGIFLIVLGLILSLPGVPGQGILTILLGLIMLDIPGKRPLEARIIKRPGIRAAIDRLRARYGKPPLILD